MSESLVPELPDFDDPLGVLRACHERMLSHCDMLQKLPEHVAANGVDEEARSAINRVVPERSWPMMKIGRSLSMMDMGQTPFCAGNLVDSGRCPSARSVFNSRV